MSSEAEKKMRADDPQTYIAWEMAQVFDNNRDAEGNLTELGFVHISQIFGSAPEEERGAIFLQFLDELDKRGIEYDVEQFMTEETRH